MMATTKYFSMRWKLRIACLVKQRTTAELCGTGATLGLLQNQMGSVLVPLWVILMATAHWNYLLYMAKLDGMEGTPAVRAVRKRVIAQIEQLAVGSL